MIAPVSAAMRLSSEVESDKVVISENAPSTPAFEYIPETILPGAGAFESEVIADDMQPLSETATIAVAPAAAAGKSSVPDIDGEYEEYAEIIRVQQRMRMMFDYETELSETPDDDLEEYPDDEGSLPMIDEAADAFAAGGGYYVEALLSIPASMAPGLAHADSITDESAAQGTYSIDALQSDEYTDADSIHENVVKSSILSDEEKQDQLTESAGIYIWPASGNLTSLFGRRSTSVGSTNHKGIDICGPNGSPIYAADSGEVITSGWSKSFGYMIEILHENGYVTLYSHCSSLLVEVGDIVECGQEIAHMGRTGIATGVHLHFEVKIDGLNVDPSLYLPDYEQ
jgi:murein DD-endopeptidase MepM/ murein hydrolase activator NlpD